VNATAEPVKANGTEVKSNVSSNSTVGLVSGSNDAGSHKQVQSEAAQPAMSPIQAKIAAIKAHTAELKKRTQNNKELMSKLKK